MLNSPVFIGLVGRLLGGSQHSLMRFLVRAWVRGMLAFTRATGFAINKQGAMRMLPFAFQPAPNWAFQGTLATVDRCGNALWAPLNFCVRPTMTSKHIHTGWQILLREWVERGMGNTGITLPFMAGALAIKRGKHFASEAEVRELIQTIVNHPVQGHFVGIRRCQNIQAPVLSLLSLKDPMIRKCELYSSDGQLSMAFSPDAMSKISGLDCEIALGCVEKLILHATPHAATGKFSRQFDPQSRSFIYTSPTQSELEFINTSSM